METNFSHLDNVEGWLNIKAMLFTSYYANRFLNGKSFDAFEIGVHHGKFFIGIENITPKSGACIGVDIFENQDINIDWSGKGSLGVFNDNVKKYAKFPKRVTAIEKD